MPYSHISRERLKSPLSEAPQTVVENSSVPRLSTADQGKDPRVIRHVLTSDSRHGTCFLDTTVTRKRPRTYENEFRNLPQLRRRTRHFVRTFKGLKHDNDHTAKADAVFNAEYSINLIRAHCHLLDCHFLNCSICHLHLDHVHNMASASC